VKRIKKTGASHAVRGMRVWRLANGRRAVPTRSQIHDHRLAVLDREVSRLVTGVIVTPGVLGDDS
jgi:hypothetical protein